MPIVVIHGPPRSGKTTNAVRFLRHYRCTRLVDNWNGRDRLVDGDLALTQDAGPYPNNRAQIVAVEQAKTAAGVR